MSTEGASSSAASDNEAFEVLICGSTDWDNIGNKSSSDPSVFINIPRIIGPLSRKRIVSIFTHSSSCHAFFISDKGEVYAMGRNKSGQLGLGHQNSVSYPQLINTLSKIKIVQAACGRSHSLLLTSEGAVYSMGANVSGQLGLSQLVNHTKPTLVTALKDYKIKAVACGLDFSMVLTDDGKVLSFGSPQYGQLGHGTDAQYFEKANKLVFQPQPNPRVIRGFGEVKIVEVVCGNNHTIARDTDGKVYSWGFGGYGRLGHRDQKDVMVPKEIPDFSGRHVGMRSAMLAAGASVSYSVGVTGHTYCFGKYKTQGDPYMYPKPVQDLVGWKIRDISAGNISNVVLADESVIAWGQGAVGELGFGEQKSSANPKKVDALEGFPLERVACGWQTTFFLAKAGDKVSKLAIWNPPGAAETKAKKESTPKAAEKDTEPAEEGKEKAVPKKRGRKPAVDGASKKSRA